MNQVPVLAVFVPLIVLALAFLMVSNLPYSAHKKTDILHPQDYKPLMIAAALLALLYFYPQNAIFLIFLAYVVSGFTNLVARRSLSGRR